MARFHRRLHSTGKTGGKDDVTNTSHCYYCSNPSSFTVTSLIQFYSLLYLQCLERTRTFIPVNVFSSTQDSLVSMGLSEDLAKRILQRKCLWLVRMSSAEIAGLHHADLYGRFNSTAQHLDIIETAAIYASLPRRSARR